MLCLLWTLSTLIKTSAGNFALISMTPLLLMTLCVCMCSAVLEVAEGVQGFKVVDHVALERCTPCSR